MRKKKQKTWERNGGDGIEEKGVFTMKCSS